MQVGWKLETSRKKKWNVHFVAEHLALLLVLRRQAEKEKEARPAMMMGTPKATASSPPMMERVQTRVMDKLFDAATTP